MKGAHHVWKAYQCDRRDRYRYRQELVSRRRPGWTWGSRAPAEVVAWADEGTPSQNAARPDRHEGPCPGRAGEGWKQARSRAREAAGGRWTGGEQPRAGAADRARAADGLGRNLGQGRMADNGTFRDIALDALIERPGQ